MQLYLAMVLCMFSEDLKVGLKRDLRFTGIDGSCRET